MFYEIFFKKFINNLYFSYTDETFINIYDQKQNQIIDPLKLLISLIIVLFVNFMLIKIFKIQK